MKIIHRSVASEIERRGITVMSGFLQDTERVSLLEEAMQMQMSPAPRVINSRPVTQDFDMGFIDRQSKSYPRSIALIDDVEKTLTDVCCEYLEDEFIFNNCVVQRYKTSHQGILPHKDGVAYGGVVANVVLQGMGKFFLCEGGGFQEIPLWPGDLVVMAANGYGRWDNTPLHTISDISDERFIYGLRWRRV